MRIGPKEKMILEKLVLGEFTPPSIYMRDCHSCKKSLWRIVDDKKLAVFRFYTQTPEDRERASTILRTETERAQYNWALMPTKEGEEIIESLRSKAPQPKKKAFADPADDRKIPLTLEILEQEQSWESAFLHPLPPNPSYELLTAARDNLLAFLDFNSTYPSPDYIENVAKALNEGVQKLIENTRSLVLLIRSQEPPDPSENINLPPNPSYELLMEARSSVLDFLDFHSSYMALDNVENATKALNQGAQKLIEITRLISECEGSYEPTPLPDDGIPF